MEGYVGLTGSTDPCTALLGRVVSVHASTLVKRSDWEGRLLGCRCLESTLRGGPMCGDLKSEFEVQRARHVAVAHAVHGPEGVRGVMLPSCDMQCQLLVVCKMQCPSPWHARCNAHRRWYASSERRARGRGEALLDCCLECSLGQCTIETHPPWLTPIC